MHTIPRIDYEKIVSASNYYASLGYAELEVPWIVHFDAYKATRPTDRQDFYTTDGYLVASGEQGFIQLMQEGRKLTKHFCITPCFRNEETLDDIHFRYFLKVELIDTDVSIKNLHSMIHNATQFFQNYLDVKVIQTDTQGEAFDIVDMKYETELGSYGIRRASGHTWIYGTGIALPRLDVVLTQ